MKFTSDSLLLYAVTDRTWLNGRDLNSCVQQAIEGGATMVQLREKHIDFEQFLKLAKQLKEVCQRFNVPLIINDNLAVAKDCDADGIHVGQSDQKLLEVIRNWDKNKIFGVSVQNVEQAKLAQQQGATYLGVGTIFKTTTKDDAEEVGIDELKSITQAVDIPVCAIGGINKTNIDKLYGTGISGVALVSEIFNQENIESNTKSLVKLTQQFKGGI